MTNMNRKLPVFVVIGANYDDYHLVGCFSSRREAEIQVKHCQDPVFKTRMDYEIHESSVDIDE